MVQPRSNARVKSNPKGKKGGNRIALAADPVRFYMGTNFAITHGEMDLKSELASRRSTHFVPIIHRFTLHLLSLQQVVPPGAMLFTVKALHPKQEDVNLSVRSIVLDPEDEASYEEKLGTSQNHEKSFLFYYGEGYDISEAEYDGLEMIDLSDSSSLGFAAELEIAVPELGFPETLPVIEINPSQGFF